MPGCGTGSTAARGPGRQTWGTSGRPPGRRSLRYRQGLASPRHLVGVLGGSEDGQPALQVLSLWKTITQTKRHGTWYNGNDERLVCDCRTGHDLFIYQARESSLVPPEFLTVELLQNL